MPGVRGEQELPGLKYGGSESIKTGYNEKRLAGPSSYVALTVSVHERGRMVVRLLRMDPRNPHVIPSTLWEDESSDGSMRQVLACLRGAAEYAALWYAKEGVLP